MLAGAVFSILFPLFNNGVDNSKVVDALDVYREQLQELEFQIDAGTKNRESLELERAEIARRILKENRRSGTIKFWNSAKLGRHFTSISALALIPILSFSLYIALGSPGVPDAPLSAQRIGKLEDKSIGEMVRMAERHLAKNPNDARGWTVLANVYGKLNRPSDRARAFEQIIKINGPTPGSLAELGEALTVADGNIVSARSRKLFERALAMDKSTLKASVYIALALEQEGRFGEALKGWVHIANSRKDDAQWQAMTSERISTMKQRIGKILSKEAAGKGEFKGPNTEQIKDASKMNSVDRKTLIKGMVARLADKLKDEPNDFDGWVRLIRSYTVLKRNNDARVALKNARNQFKNDPSLLKKLNSFAQQINLSTTKLLE